MTIAIETQDLTRVHRLGSRGGEVRALDNVSLQIHENVITGLLGRNGAGKTTLMSLVTAQDRQTSGEVTVLGERPFENAHVLERMCFIRDNQRYPDDYALRHALRAGRIFYPGWDQALADELVELFRIPRKTVIKKYSRGQFSALGIVIGLASRSPITILDEPYLGLDATARGYFYDTLLREYQEHPRTIVLSTHLIDEMDQLLERVVILEQGRVVQDANIDELRGHAHQVSGRETDVERYATGRAVLRRHRVGGLASFVIEGRLSDEDRLNSQGLEFSPVSLQDLVAAYGAGEPSGEGAAEGAGTEAQASFARKGAES